MFENFFLKGYSQNYLGVMMGDFLGGGCPNEAEMPCRPA